MSTLLSKKTDYALLILAHLHEHPTGGSAREVSERFGLSKAFLANILKELCQKGFLISHRGVKGGYSLQRPAGQITLAELLQSMEDGWKFTTCADEGDDQPHDCTVHNVCPIRGPLTEIHRRLLAALAGVTLADVFRPGGQPSTTFQPVLTVLNHRPAAGLHEIPA
jgi:Rrf2 family transcriptional regulator, cysteine metabolism repressor